MKVLCAYSGIEFSVEHFPAYLSNCVTHPVFDLPQHRLLSYANKWAAGELTQTDSYLLFLSLLNSTDLIFWRSSAERTQQTASLIAQNMEKLLSIVGKINIIKHPAFALPHFVISHETRNLKNVQYWIEAWTEAYEDWSKGYKNRSIEQRLIQREAALEKLIKNPQKSVDSYANILADWAAEAGDFPTSATLVGSKSIPLSEYWKQIIRKCAKAESVFSIPKQDIEELIEHCELNIPHGSIFAAALMKLLRNGLTSQKDFLGVDLSEVTFRILSPETSVEDANKQSIIDSAPKQEPKITDYPTRFAYVKAKLAWQMAQNYSGEKK